MDLLDPRYEDDASPPLPMLVSGIAGVPGYNAFHYFRDRYGDQVIGVRQSNMWPLSGDGIVACDAEDADSVARLWDQYRFRSLLNFGGCCRLKSCELNVDMAHRVNVVGAENMIAQAVRHDARVIHLSVDLVFAGRDGGSYDEQDATDPVTVYGAKMVEAENVVLSQCDNACVLRISLPMGISFNEHAGAIDWIASRFKQNKPATLFTDEVRTPTYTDCMNGLFATLLDKPLTGLYHAGGPRRLTLYQIGQIVNRVGGYDPDLLHKSLRHEAGPMPPRAGDVSMDSSKLQQDLGYNPFDPWPLTDEWLPTHERWHYERDDGFSGSEAKIKSLLYQNPDKPGMVPPSRNEVWGASRFA
ncbi:SDR family oxidoreductase [Novipirellula rosea]|uniref:RmlD-like substrate binding domain-containing protein n=1 Tax=Novipirellula rosea TaxID=1031540 RepID=A0ABP8NAG6_9BACT